MNGVFKAIHIGVREDIEHAVLSLVNELKDNAKTIMQHNFTVMEIVGHLYRFCGNNYIKFEDGRELKTIGDHRVFNIDKQKFLYGMNEQDTPLGTKVFLEDGATTRITEREVIHEKIEYYNIITDYHMNLFANGILTSLRLNNLYEIKDMKFIKDDRELVKREEYKNIPDKYFNGLRLAEQPKEINKGNDVKHTNTLEEYVQRIINMEK